MTSDTSEIPIYAYIITIALLCIVYALVAAAKRSLDNTDRNTIKELSESDPEDSRVQAVMRFIQKPSEYHYADLFLSYLTLIMSFFLFHSLMKREMGDNHWMILWDILYFVAFIGVADILPKKLASQSQICGLSADGVLYHLAVCKDMCVFGQRISGDTSEEHGCGQHLLLGR